MWQEAFHISAGDEKAKKATEILTADYLVLSFCCSKGLTVHQIVLAYIKK